MKIRDNLYKDFVRLDLYGFFVQKEKFAPWDILRKEDITEQEKYILGCTPMLLFDSKPVPLPAADLVPVKGINPPSVLGHGLQNHSRTAVGLKNNQIYFILVEEDLVHGGCNLFDLQKIGLKLGLEKMLNLDGGGSSQLKIFENNSWTESYVAPEDKDRILGNVIVLFDERLK